MTKITVKSLLNIGDSSQYKFHCARWNDKHQPLDIYVKDKKKWFQWNTWRGTKDEFDLVITFPDYPQYSAILY